MADLLLKRDSRFAATCVPNTFIDEYMTHADGEFVKIYLYLLRCMASSSETVFSISDTADKFDHTEKDVKRALKYWEKLKLLKLEYNKQDDVISVCLSEPTAYALPETVVSPAKAGVIPAVKVPSNSLQMPQEEPKGSAYNIPGAMNIYENDDAAIPFERKRAFHDPGAPLKAASYPVRKLPGASPVSVLPQKATGMPGAPAYRALSADIPGASAYPACGKYNATPAFAEKEGSGNIPERTDYTPLELALFSEDETVQEVLFIAERYLSRTLKDAEIQTIIYWMDKLKLSQDMIDYLIEQCVAKNHKDIRYMNSIAISWAQQGIHTLAQAQQESTNYSEAARRVKKAFGIYGRNLCSDELVFFKKWTEEMHLPEDLIELACQRTISCIHSINFKYAHSILEDWHRQNARTINDVKLLDAQFQEGKRQQANNSKAAKYTSDGAGKNSRTGKINPYMSFKQRTYNYDELERELLGKTR